jgi:hypothetical protein
MLVCAIVVWSGYRFSYYSFGTLLATENTLREKTEKVVNQIAGDQGLLHDVAYSILNKIPIPAPEFLVGLRWTFVRNKVGHPVYFLNEIRRQGWWYLYPVLLALKTPIPFLLFSVNGLCFALRQVMTKQNKLQLLMPAIAALGILVVGMLSSVNNGIRQILGVYPLLAVLAGYGASQLLTLQRFRRSGVGLTILLLSWQIVSSFTAAPNYIAYFNEFVGKDPGAIVVNDDLDWGQDLKSLTVALKNRDVQSLAVKYNGSTAINLDQFHLPSWRELVPYQKTIGWVAISEFHLTLGTGVPPYDQYVWLKNYQPVAQVGRSIWLYNIPDQ